jgi:hypothetical protein
MALGIAAASTVAPVSPAAPRGTTQQSTPQPGNVRADQAAAQGTEREVRTQRAESETTEAATAVREQDEVNEQSREARGGGIDVFA